MWGGQKVVDHLVEVLGAHLFPPGQASLPVSPEDQFFDIPPRR
jgi:hypothetical protein